MQRSAGKFDAVMRRDVGGEALLLMRGLICPAAGSWRIRVLRPRCDQQPSAYPSEPTECKRPAAVKASPSIRYQQGEISPCCQTIRRQRSPAPAVRLQQTRTAYGAER